MRHKLEVISFSVVLLTCSIIILADDNPRMANSLQLPPIETFLLQPIELENISIWVPANKVGPLINRTCTHNTGILYLSTLPASVHHIKMETCPDTVARLLAEYAAHHHPQNLPLTVFNGWQWEYSYGMCQSKSVKYNLPCRGGSWENSWEAVLTQSTGSANFLWLKISFTNDFLGKPDNSESKTSIEVKTFSSMRTRDGYPKERQL